MELLKAARAAARNAYAPYSGFAVGAAVETVDGSVYTGANMENASYGVTMCAEVGAIQSASTAGKLADILRIAVSGANIDESLRTGNIVTPCGRCRQLILESAEIGKRDIEVWCADLDMTRINGFSISQLLPHGFGPASLAVKTSGAGRVADCFNP